MMRGLVIGILLLFSIPVMAAKATAQFTQNVYIDTVTIAWNESSENVASFNILRTTTSGGYYDPIGSSLTDTFVDSTPLVGNVYYYVVVAVRTDGAVSGYSKEVMASLK